MADWIRKIGIHSLRNRLTVVFGGLSLAATLALSAYIEYFSASRIAADQGRDYVSIARALANSLAATLVEREREVQLLVQRPLFIEGPLDGADIRQQLTLIKASYKYYAWIGVADATGVVRAAANGLLEGGNVSKRPWFSNGMSGAFVGDAHEAVLLAKHLKATRPDEPLRFVDFASPIIDARGQVRGVVATHANWDWVGDVLENSLPQATRDGGLEVFVVNRNGALLHPFASMGVLKLPATLPDDGNYAMLDWGDGRYLTSLVSVKAPLSTELGWKVVIRQPLEKAQAVIGEFHRILLVAGIAVTLLAMLIAYRLAAAFARPVEQLAAAAEQVRHGQEATSVFAVDSKLTELRRLAYALRGMTVTLIRRKRGLEESNRTLEARVEERTKALELANRELHHLSRHDPLTSLPNRRAFNEHVHEEFQRMKRSGKGYAVVMVDIDHFKRVNDTWGHEVGDSVLRHVAEVLRASARVTDFVARLGGEEFIVILPETVEQATGVAEKMRAAIAASDIPVVGKVTASLGVAIAVPADADDNVAVVAADEALYRAKGEGRNRVVLAGVTGDVSAG